MSNIKSATLAATGTDTTKVSIDYITADTIGISYNTLPGNIPNSYGNFVSIWQNSNSIPWNAEPFATKPIPNNSQKGSMNFDGLDIAKNQYIIGYSVGTKLETGQTYGNVSSSAYAPDSNPANQSNLVSSLGIIFVGIDSVAFSYKLPDGCTPNSNGAWCGIWRSSNGSYNNTPDKAVPVTLDTESGTLTFDALTIGLGQTYTIALFMSGWKGGNSPTQTTMACTVTFTNS